MHDAVRDVAKSIASDIYLFESWGKCDGVAKCGYTETLHWRFSNAQSDK